MGGRSTYLHSAWRAQRVQGTGGGGGVQRKAEFCDRQRGLDLDAWASGQGDDNGAAALGTGWGKAGHGGGGELGQGGLFVSQLAWDHGGIVGDVDDSSPCEEAQHAGADDLEQVGHLVGAKAGQGAKDGDTRVVGDENAVQENSMDVWIEPEVGARPLQREDGATLAILDGVGGHAAAVPAEDGIGEHAAHGAHQFAVVTESRSQRVRQGEKKLSQWNSW